MQPELLPTPNLDETEEKLNARIDKLYRNYGQNWSAFFEHTKRPTDEREDFDLLPARLLDRARQQSDSVLAKR